MRACSCRSWPRPCRPPARAGTTGRPSCDERDDERETEIDQQAAAAGEFVNPIAFFRALEQAAGDNAMLVADGGDFVATASYVLHPRAPLSWLDPGAFGTLGVGAGFALGAALARPDAEVWIVFGDGACGYGLAEFDTFVRHGIPVIAVVGNDAGWTQIAREQVKMLHDDVATVLARTDYHAVAAAFGAAGHPGQAHERSAGGAGPGPRAGEAGQAGAGERLARQDRVPRGIAVDVAGKAGSTIPLFGRIAADQGNRLGIGTHRQYRLGPGRLPVGSEHHDAAGEQARNDHQHREHQPACVAAPQPEV